MQPLINDECVHIVSESNFKCMKKKSVADKLQRNAKNKHRRKRKKNAGKILI